MECCRVSFSSCVLLSSRCTALCTPLAPAVAACLSVERVDPAETVDSLPPLHSAGRCATRRRDSAMRHPIARSERDPRALGSCPPHLRALHHAPALVRHGSRLGSLACFCLPHSHSPPPPLRPHRHVRLHHSGCCRLVLRLCRCTESERDEGQNLGRRQCRRRRSSGHNSAAWRRARTERRDRSRERRATARAQGVRPPRRTRSARRELTAHPLVASVLCCLVASTTSDEPHTKQGRTANEGGGDRKTRSHSAPLSHAALCLSVAVLSSIPTLTSAFTRRCSRTACARVPTYVATEGGTLSVARIQALSRPNSPRLSSCALCAWARWTQ